MGKGLEGRGQGIEYLTPHKPLPLSKGTGIPLVLLAGMLNFHFFIDNLRQQINVLEGPDRPGLGETTGKFMLKEVIKYFKFYLDYLYL